MKKYVIWDSDAVDEQYVKDYRLEMEEEYPDQNDDWWWDAAMQDNNEMLDIERQNLSSINYPQEIVIFADLGLWHGRVPAYKKMHTARLSEVLCRGFCTDWSHMKWWVDAYGNLRAEETHHDGTNKYLFRIFKDSVSEDTETLVLNKWERGAGTKDDITRYTRRIGKEIADVYGWKVRK